MRKARLTLIRKSIKKQMKILRKLSVPEGHCLCLSLQRDPSPFCLLSNLGIHPAPCTRSSASSKLTPLCVLAIGRFPLSLNFLRHLLSALPPPEIFSYSLLLHESCLRPAVAHVHGVHHLVFPFLQASYCCPDPVVSAEKSSLS